MRLTLLLSLSILFSPSALGFDVITRGPRGQTHAFFSDNGTRVIARQCPDTALIQSPADVERECPGSYDLTWTRASFKRELKHVFYFPDAPAVIRDSEFALLRHYHQDAVEKAIDRKIELDEEIRRLELLVEDSPGSGYEEKLARAKAEHTRIRDIADLGQRFDNSLEQLLDEILDGSRMVKFAYGNIPQRYTLALLLGTSSKYYVCRKCWDDRESKYLCQRGRSLAEVKETLAIRECILNRSLGLNEISLNADDKLCFFEKTGTAGDIANLFSACEERSSRVPTDIGFFRLDHLR